VGIRVEAYAGNTLEMNMTIPLSGTSIYNATINGTNQIKLSSLNSGYGTDSYSNSNTASIGIMIYTPDFVTNYTVTPVWTNAP
jgi:hypothetical protein